MIKDSGDRTKFGTGAVRDMHAGKGRMDLLPLSALIELSKHCEEGALKYGEHNVDKGIPQHSLCDSAMRHLVKYMRGDTDEPHLRAAAWNLMWALNQSVECPELVDVPWREEEERCPDPTAGRAIREADRPPENVVMFRRMIKSMCTIFHLRILGKVTIVDEKGRRW